MTAASAIGQVRDKAVRIVVWDERQPKQKSMYEDFLGNHIADYLRKQEGFKVRSVGLDDPQQGLSEEILNNCDVLIWWGHVRQGEVSIETSQRIVERIKTSKLNLITLHSAHWSTPFMVAMEERSRQDALAKLSSADRAKARVEWAGEFGVRQAQQGQNADGAASDCQRNPGRFYAASDRDVRRAVSCAQA